MAKSVTFGYAAASASRSFSSRPSGRRAAAIRICGARSSAPGSATRKKLMPKVSQRTLRRLVTASSTGTPWTSKTIVEPTPRPRSRANSSSTLTSARAGSLQSAPATIWLSAGSRSS